MSADRYDRWGFILLMISTAILTLFLIVFLIAQLTSSPDHPDLRRGQEQIVCILLIQPPDRNPNTLEACGVRIHP